MIDIAYAMGQGGGAAAGGAGGFSSFIPLILMFVIFYFLLIRPQQKKQKEHRDMIASLKKGDRIVTSGGFARPRHRIGREHLDRRNRRKSPCQGQPRECRRRDAGQRCPGAGQKRPATGQEGQRGKRRKKRGFGHQVAIVSSFFARTSALGRTPVAPGPGCKCARIPDLPHPKHHPGLLASGSGSSLDRGHGCLT